MTEGSRSSLARSGKKMVELRVLKSLQVHSQQTSVVHLPPMSTMVSEYLHMSTTAHGAHKIQRQSCCRCPSRTMSRPQTGSCCSSSPVQPTPVQDPQSSFLLLVFFIYFVLSLLNLFLRSSHGTGIFKIICSYVSDQSRIIPNSLQLLRKYLGHVGLMPYDDCHAVVFQPSVALWGSIE